MLWATRSGTRPLAVRMSHVCQARLSCPLLAQAMIRPDTAEASWLWPCGQAHEQMTTMPTVNKQA